MSLKNIKNSQGFTIVELLIVVVVIAILAAITIVSYNGITTRANASSAKSTASTVQKKIELFQADKSRYPYNKAELNVTGQPFDMTGVEYTDAAPTKDNGTDTVQVQACLSSGTTTTASNVTGIRVSYYDFEKTSNQVTPITLGTCATTFAPLLATATP